MGYGQSNCEHFKTSEKCMILWQVNQRRGVVTENRKPIRSGILAKFVVVR